MDDVQLFFKKLNEVSQLGEIVGVPESISGGLLHKMYAVKTTKEKYAVKLLNLQIMLRPEAISNYINSERIANLVSGKVPSVPAKIINGDIIQRLDNQYFLVFSWIEGKCLNPKEINKTHCEKIGSILADIHKLDFFDLDLNYKVNTNRQQTNWNFYLERGRKNNAEWFDLLFEIIDKLNVWNALAIRSANLLTTNLVISHRDLDPKNVLWNQDKPVLIDWESAGFINPVKDLIEIAIYWSEDEMGNVDRERFFAFIRGYKMKYGEIQADSKAVLENGFLGKLG
jgi:Ser/Thr protein kinase RdoA (MazF antagonist)